MNQRKESVLDHAYDGIQEYDNPTPGWWHMIFLASVLFAFLYFVFFHGGGEFSWSPQSLLKSEETAHFERLFGELGALEGDADTILGLTSEPKWLAVGASVFARNCTQCHAADGAGLNGPNLTDDTWINVRQVDDIFRIISDGVVPKGMPAWGNRLQQNDRVVVAAYVASLRASPRPGRAPEGEVIPPWPAPEPAASAAN